MHYANREGWDFTQMAQWASTDFRLDLENCPHCELEFPLDDLKSAYIKVGECKEQHAARTEEGE
jgi:hypothetical protein